MATLIASPTDYPRARICDECVAVGNSLLEDRREQALQMDGQEGANENGIY
jgi:ATP-dependent Clp protease ATP-binding subunit ClpX